MALVLPQNSIKNSIWKLILVYKMCTQATHCYLRIDCLIRFNLKKFGSAVLSQVNLVSYCNICSIFWLGKVACIMDATHGYYMKILSELRTD